MKDMKLGIQMWSIYDVCMREGFPKVFELLHDMGYQGMEFCLNSDATLRAKFDGNIDLREVIHAARDNDIKLIGTHLSMERLLEDPAPILDECLELGLPCAAIGPAFYADRTPIRDQQEMYGHVVRFAQMFKQAGIQLQVHCSAFGYLRDYRGRRVVDAMFEEAGLENLQPEFDTAWMICGGVIPTEYLKKYRDYVDYLHFKDFHPPLEDSDYILVRHNAVADHYMERGTAVGLDGIQDLGAIISTARECSTKWLIVELWNEPDSLENAEISINNLKAHM